MDCNRLNQTPIPQHIFPVPISAASAEHSSEKCSADITGFKRSKGAHINRHELALTCLIQTPTDSSAVKERHFCMGNTNPQPPSSRAAAATRYLYASKVAACCQCLRRLWAHCDCSTVLPGVDTEIRGGWCVRGGQPTAARPEKKSTKRQ